MAPIDYTASAWTAACVRHVTQSQNITAIARKLGCTISNKINDTPKGARLSEKLWLKSKEASKWASDNIYFACDDTYHWWSNNNYCCI